MDQLLATEIVFLNGTRTHANEAFFRKEPFLQPGDVLVVRRPFTTAGNRSFVEGDELILKEKTFEHPFGHLCTSGNWRVQTGQDASSGLGVWSSIERAYAEGILELKPRTE